MSVNTKFKFAVINNDIESVLKYVKTADINLITHFPNDLSAISYACKNNQIEIVKILLENDADIKDTNNFPLRTACTHGYYEIVELLIKHGADVNYKNGIFLRNACTSGHLDVIKLLIKHGANINAEDNGALRWAMFSRKQEVITYLQNLYRLQILEAI